LLYDCLKDDDKEIRDLSAEIAAKIFRLWEPRTESFGIATSSVVSIKLAKLITMVPDISMVSRKIAIQRMTGSTVKMKELSPTFATTFQAALAESTALFAVEKQNLYADEVHESNIWAKVLKKLPYKRNHVNMLERWTYDGLQLLIRTTQSRPDGALGWGSKPEVFILAIRMINAADVLLSWLSSLGDIERGSRVRSSLAYFIQYGEKTELHELILAKASRVLERAIIPLLRHIVKSLKRTVE
jgi:hypothetical protein